MGKPLSLTAKDSHRLGAYRADPAGKPLGGVVVVQEIFGVNHHIRSVCDRLAALGYAAVAPALFDRFARDFQSGYSPEEVAQARKFLADIDWAAFVADTTAAVEALPRPVAVLGFCMGGTVAYLAATQLDGLAAAVCFYGGQIVKSADRKPRCPGRRDDPSQAARLRNSRLCRRARFLLRRAGELPCRKRGDRLGQDAAVSRRRDGQGISTPRLRADPR